jgi:metal-responsive CopG/Arc/MetJ family transcriptional regulator
MGKEKTYTRRVTVLLTEQEAEKLENLCKEKGTSLSALMRMAVREWIKMERRNSKNENTFSA